jgi:hypothetical protein
MGFYTGAHCSLIEKVVLLFEFCTSNIEKQWDFFKRIQGWLKTQVVGAGSKVVSAFVSSDIHIYRLLRIVIYDVERFVYGHRDESYDINRRMTRFEGMLKKYIDDLPPYHHFDTFQLPTLKDPRVARFICSLCKTAQKSGWQPHRFWISSKGGCISSATSLLNFLKPIL